MRPSAKRKGADSDSHFRNALSGLSTAGYGVYKPFIYCEMVRSQLARGEIEAAMGTMAELDQLDPEPRHWLSPCVYLSKSELVLAQDLSAKTAARKLVEKAIDISRQQGAVLWEKQATKAMATLG